MTITFLSHYNVDGVPKSVQMDDIGSANALATIWRRVGPCKGSKVLRSRRKMVGASSFNRSQKNLFIAMTKKRC